MSRANRLWRSRRSLAKYRLKQVYGACGLLCSIWTLQDGKSRVSLPLQPFGKEDVTDHVTLISHVISYPKMSFCLPISRVMLAM